MHLSTTIFGAGLCIAVLVALSLIAQRYIRRNLRLQELQEHHEVTDPLLQVVGTMFAILLGFMVADAMSRFATARQIVQQEASSVGDVFRLAGGFSPADRDRIQSLCLIYVDDVISDEWPKLNGFKTSNKVWKTYNELWATLNAVKVKDDSEASVLQSILPCMVSVGDNRRMRVEAMHNGLAPVMWVVLGIAGAATILFTFFFGARNYRLQVIMTSIIVVVIGLNVFMLATYNDPFSGDVIIGPDAFIVDQRSLGKALDHTDPYEIDESQ